MATSIKEGLNYIIQAIQNMIEPQLDKLRYDRTYRAKVLEKVKDGVYRVQINGSEYQIKYNGNLNIGSVIKVKAPLNNFSDIYPETTVITNISELNNDSQFMLCFNNVTEMKSYTEFKVGMCAKTLGFYEKDDGGGAVYQIRNANNQSSANEMDIISLNNELVAELIKNDNILNVRQLGAKGDGNNDVSNIINSFSNKYSLRFPAGLYNIQNDINIYYSLYGEGFSRENHVSNDKTWFLLNGSINILGNSERVAQNLDNINIKVNESNAKNIINFNPTTYTLFYGNNISIYNYQKIALNVNVTNSANGTRLFYFNNVTMWAKPNSDTTGLLINGHATDLKVENFECMYSKIGIENHTMAILNNTHIWTGETGTDINDWWAGTRGIINYGYIIGSNIYIDSAYRIISNFGGSVRINGFYYWEDTSMNGSTKYDGYLAYTNNIFDAQNVVINNGSIYAGKRLAYFSCQLSNIQIIVDTETDFNRITNSASLQFIKDNFYILDLSNDKQTAVTYPCIAVIAQNANGASELQITFTGGENVLLSIVKGYDTDIIIKGTYEGRTRNCYYEIKNKKIYIYAERPSTDDFITSCNILHKSRYLFPYNLHDFVFTDRSPFKIPAKTTTTGLTQINITQKV